MKKFFTLLLMALFVQIGFAQIEGEDDENDIEEVSTIFTKKNFKVTGGYIAPDVRVGNVHEDASISVGGKLGMTFNKHFTIGLAGYGLLNNSNFKTTVEVDSYPTNTLASIGMGYGGLLLEYSFLNDKKIHFSIPVIAGIGGVTIYEDLEEYKFNESYDIESSFAFAVEPGVNIVLNFFKHIRFDVGASYRMISGTKLDNLSDDDLTDLSFNASVRFGFF